MKPVYSVLIRRSEKEHVMNFPMTSRRLDKTIKALGYGNNEPIDGAGWKFEG